MKIKNSKNRLDLKDSIFETKNKVAVLRFNRDDIRNALTGSSLIDDILKTSDYVNKNKNISVLIITGSGKAFSSGGNIKEMFKKNSSFSGKVEEVEKKYKVKIDFIQTYLKW